MLQREILAHRTWETKTNLKRTPRRVPRRYNANTEMEERLIAVAGLFRPPGQDQRTVSGIDTHFRTGNIRKYR